jgi:2-keto-4-pentenoate hydratase/2-oxohepta-3-ene-1,7-dioic acid hydratase in catechol pathway
MQDGSTSTMAYGLAHIVSYLSQFMSLNPSDVILTGTPPGVGMGQKPNNTCAPVTLLNWVSQA